MKGLRSIYVTFWLMLVVCFLSLSLNSIAKGASKVVVGTDSDARSLDPVLTMDMPTMRVLRHLYDDLFYRDQDMKIVPLLAESGEMVNDLTWRITLKKGIKFHNGELFNAESVKYTIDFILNPANKALTKSLIAKIDHVEIIDDYTVDIITKVPNPTLLENLNLAFMAPPELAKKKGMEYLSEHPVGTGAYTLESWSKDREITLVKKEHYWRGEPPIDRLVFRVIPEPSSRISALLAGEVDLIPDVPPHLIKRVNDSNIASVKSVAGRRMIFIALDNINEGPLKDVRVRQAMNYAVNVDEIINTVMEGYATRINGPLIPINKHVDPALKPYSYDPVKAKQLLRDAGYGKGLQLTLNSCQGRYLKDKEFAQAVASQLRAIGVDVKVKYHEWGTYLKMIKSYKAGDMHVLGRSDVQLEGGILSYLFKTGASYVTFSDPQVDKELASAMPIMNPPERAKAMKKLQATIQQAAPWIFLWQQHNIYGVNNRLDWKPRADEEFHFFEARLKK